MIINYYDIGQVEDEKLEFAVIITFHNDKLVLVRHKERETWEVPGGHREKGEAINAAGARELVEETGAVIFDIQQVYDYSVTMNDNTRYGRIFLCKVQKLGELSESEIGEVRLFDSLPDNLTYSAIQPYLYKELERRMNLFSSNVFM